MRYAQRPPPYRDVARFVHAIVREFTPQRLVWGSDWPFLRTDRRCDYGPLLAVLARAVPDPSGRRAVLASTPARWFFGV
jgi:predicted TIM-barrel fold metal-dependent hydrolase